VPAFSQAVTAIARLGDPVRRGQEATAAALVRAREGAWPEGLAIEARFFADSNRSFEIVLAQDGNVVEIERRGQRERRSILGPATADEKKTIAQAILGAHFPHSHGAMKPVTGPHYRLRVVKGDVRVDVILDAEDVHKRGAAEGIRLLYAAAVRFGKKPLELPEESAAAPSPPMGAPASSLAPKSTARFAQEVLELVNGRIAFPTFARWLAEHKGLWVPATAVDGGYLPAIVEEGGVTVLRVFTTEGSLDAWIAGAGKPAAVMRDTGGAGLFGKMPDKIARVDVDPSAPITLQVHGDMLTLLRSISRGVNIERAFAAPDAPSRSDAANTARRPQRSLGVRAWSTQ
jgi:hypothetical protein